MTMEKIQAPLPVGIEDTPQIRQRMQAALSTTWVVEINQGGVNWTPICLCHSKEQAEKRAAVHTDSPVRVREKWKAAL
jgi:hypothetical protein